MKIENSSAITDFNFDKGHGIIGITFRQGKEYDFSTDDSDAIRNEVETTVANKESVGALYNTLLKEDRLTKVAN